MTRISLNSTKGDDRFMAKGCDCDVNELLKKPIFPHASNASYIPVGERGGLVFCDQHHGWVNFEWIKEK
jgi:hypothetical protein